MLGLKKLPVGFESFQEIRKLECYYVDKTKLIEQSESVYKTSPIRENLKHKYA